MTPWIGLVGTTHPLGFAGLNLSLALAPALGVRAAAVCTGITAQGLDDVLIRTPLDDATIAAQFRALDAVAPAAYHVGAQLDARVVRTVERELSLRWAQAVGVDPVIATSGGARLADDATIAVLRSELFACALLVTPNLDEAERLLGATVRDEAAMREAGRALLGFGPQAVLIKGGHLAATANEVVDVLVTATETRTFRSSRAGSMRGTGDALATAIAARLALGEPLAAAVDHARRFVLACIADAEVAGGMRVAPLQPERLPPSES